MPILFRKKMRGVLSILILISLFSNSGRALAVVPVGATVDESRQIYQSMRKVPCRCFDITKFFEKTSAMVGGIPIGPNGVNVTALLCVERSGLMTSYHLSFYDNRTLSGEAMTGDLAVLGFRTQWKWVVVAQVIINEIPEGGLLDIIFLDDMSNIVESIWVPLIADPPLYPTGVVPQGFEVDGACPPTRYPRPPPTPPVLL